MVTGRHPSDPRRTTREEVLRLKNAGLKGTEIAAALHITPTRVSQLIKALREDGRLEEVAS